MIKLPSWMTRQSSTPAEFAERAEEARRDCAMLAEAKRIAQAEYDSAPSAKSEDALLAAGEAVQRGELRLGSAERALTGARQAEAAKRRSELDASKAPLVADLTRDALDQLRAPGAHAEATALIAAATAYARRWQQEVEITAKRSTLAELQTQLGEPTSAVMFDAPDALPIARTLQAHLHTIDGDAPERPYLIKLITLFDGQHPALLGIGPQTARAERAVARLPYGKAGGAA